MSNLDLRLGDSTEILKTIADESVDLVVTSPPYDNLRTYEGSLKWDFDVFKGIANELARVLKKGGVIVWVVGDSTIKGSETGSSFRQALYFKDECGLNLHDTMIWNKNNFTAVGALKTRYSPVFEYMFVLSKGSPKSFNPLKDRKNISFGRKTSGTIRQQNGTSKPINKIGVSISEYGQRHNVWIQPPEMTRNNSHPAPYPCKLAEDHIISWSNEGDTILDPFMGSGTTGLACKNMDRNFIGIEKVEEYYNLSKERLKEHTEDSSGYENNC